jgi:hypothetical protein
LTTSDDYPIRALFHSIPNRTRVRRNRRSIVALPLSTLKTYKRICDFDITKPVDVRVFTLGDVIECFVNDAYCFTMHGYNSTGSGLSVKTLAGNSTIQGNEVGALRK